MDKFWQRLWDSSRRRYSRNMMFVSLCWACWRGGRGEEESGEKEKRRRGGGERKIMV